MVFAVLRSPRWLVGTVVAVVAVVVFASLGLWQLRRLDERRLLAATIEERTSLPPVSLPALIDEFGSEPAALSWRVAEAEGSYLADEQVILVGRSRDGRGGNNVLTPLRLADDTAIVVNRGWIPIDAEPPTPPAGTVTVTGVVRQDEGSGLLGGGSGEVSQLSRVDLARLDAQSDVDLLPIYLQLTGQVPPTDVPAPMPIPDIGEGPHLSYAVQWFLFAAIVAVGFPVLVWRTSRRPVTRPPPSTPSSAA